MEQLQSISLSGSAITDLSIWSLFLQADFIIQLVIVLLILASFWCWAIIFDKWRRIRRLSNEARQFEEMFWSGGSLDDLYDRIGTRPNDPMSAIFVAAMREWRRSASQDAVDEHTAVLTSRIDRVMDITLGREMAHLERLSLIHI